MRMLLPCSLSPLLLCTRRSCPRRAVRIRLLAWARRRRGGGGGGGGGEGWAMMGKLVFAVNGERREVSEAEVPEPSITLLEFLRTRTRFKGAKLGCGEGGCGACAVLLSTYDPVTDQVNDFTVSSCLTLLCSINLCSITTTEGLGNSKDGFHSIHRRLSGFHASQCGFCTPGMCMSLLSSLVNADKTNQPDPPEGFSKLLVSEAEKAVLGNLCRCTGYRPILDTCKSFAADVDLEDLGLNSFWKRGVKSFSAYSNVAEISSFGGGYWCRPKSIKELYKLLDSEEFSKSHVKMVVGNTASGVYKELDLFDKYIDLREIPELTMIKNNHEGLEIGAAVSISRTVEALREENQSLVFSKIADHMEKVASQFVRNTASMGGNLVMAQRNHFPSDIATILLAADSTVCLQLSSERLSLTLEEFLEMPPCDHKTLLVSIYIPSWISRTDLLFETYRAAPRPLGNALAYLNSAFLAETSLDKESGDVVIENLRLAFGAYGCPHAIRARKVEKFLLGKAIRSSVLLEGIRLLRETIIPEQGTPHAAYRISLAVAFLFSFLHPVTAGLEKPMKNNRNVLENVSVSAECPNGSLNGHANITLDSASEHGNHCNRMLSSSEQIMELNKEYHPVGEPTKKAGAEIQASGEAVYVDDIPSPNDCLYGAFVYSTRPFAHVKSIEFHSSLAQQKIIKIVSIDDIPKGGSNIGASSMFGSDPLFADSLTEYAGQPLSVVIAETQRFANLAAKHAVVAYSTENLEPPILSVEDAVKRSSYFEVPSFVYPKEVGDYSKGMAEADHTILSAKVTLGSQYYFYMETQTALAIPDEDNCMVVYSSSQCPETAQGVIAKCLGIPFHNVRVITRRVGGGFGGKALRSLPVATACALAAYKLRRPVRMYLDRKTDMIMVGGRHPMKVYYSVGFKSDGKITALHIDLLINAGRTKDVSPIMPHNIIEALKKYNWGSLSFDVKVCKTNTPTRSAMRAPGEVQGSYIAEAVIEHVASALGVEPNSIRQKNLHTFESLKLFYEGCEDEALEYTLPTIFDKLAFSSSYRHRVEMIKRFNSSNQWKKRGISCVPIVHKVILRPTPGKVSVLNDGSIVVEVGGLNWARVVDKSEADGGFCSWEVVGLKSLKERLEIQQGTVSWDSLIMQANLESVNLSATAYWVPDGSSASYLNFGAAVSEVEVDLLTGTTTILRSDLTYDCGQSLNPAVDLGQVEGAFVQGIGFFMYEEYLSNSDGLVVSDGTWTYKVPTVDTIPKQFNVELINSGYHKRRVLSSKASGEPPLLLAASVHCATREAIRAARAQLLSLIGSEESPLAFDLAVPATMPVVKELCGLKNVDKYLAYACKLANT
uniref:Uncharacterized protein n=1 Tax=Ananas comosus var. bracteatus TaxID=296719 RepID=A0A6V7NM36_ANACO|nr:unnamed protein product [Ananas comosus var. bracteatus]